MFDDIVGVSIEEFNREYRGKQHLVCKSSGHPFTGVLSWGRLNDIINGSDRYVGSISVVREDYRLDRRNFTLPNGKGQRVVPSALRKALQDGYSLLFDQVQEYDEQARLISQLFMNELGEHTGVNVYVSWKTDKCFLTHWDDHDVFILQTEGEKEWTVYKPTREHPMSADIEYATDKENLTLAWEGPLRRGDVLYVPRGWWHHAKSTGSGSIHMTLGFSGRTSLDVFQHLTMKAAGLADFRRDMVRPGAGPEYEGFKAALRDQIVAFIDQQFDDGAIDEFWRHHYGMLPARNCSSLPFVMGLDEFKASDLQLQITGLAPQITLVRREDDFTIELGGRNWDLAISAFELVRRFTEGDVTSSKWLASQGLGGLSAAESMELMFDLLNEGIIGIVESDEHSRAVGSPVPVHEPAVSLAG